MNRIRKLSAKQRKENLKDIIYRKQQKYLMCQGKLYITGLRKAGLNPGVIIDGILFLQFLT